MLYAHKGVIPRASGNPDNVKTMAIGHSIY